MRTILITGGTGFLGTNLALNLAKEHQVYALDNFLTSSDQNINLLKSHPNIEVIEHDVRDHLQLKGDFHEVYHLACPASPIHYQKDPILTTETNVLGTLNMLRFAQEKQTKFLLASTSEVYGNPKIHPQKESYLGDVNPVGLRACYNEGKRTAESLTMDFHRLYGLEIKIIRIFNTYGPHMHPNDGRVISNFIMQGLEQKSLTVYGDGSQTRSFCYVDDMIDGMIKVMGTPFSVTGPLNLGNDIEFSVLELAHMIKNAVSSKIETVFKDLPLDDPERRQPDLSKVKETIDWHPKTNLAQGITKTAEYFKASH